MFRPVQFSPGYDIVPRKRIEWNQRYTTQIRALDDHHSDLIDQLNAFADAIDAKMSVPGLIRMFDRILSDVEHHFTYEEQILRNIGYTEYSLHKKQHDVLLADAREIAHDLRLAKFAADIEPAVTFLNALIIKHMAEQDTKISTHITHGLLGETASSSVQPASKALSLSKRH